MRALQARAEAVWRENAEARHSFHMQNCPPPYIKKKTSHSLVQVSKNILNISVQWCIQVIPCQMTVSVPLYAASPDLQRKKRFKVHQRVPFPAQSLRDHSSHPMYLVPCLWSAEKGHHWVGHEDWAMRAPETCEESSIPPPWAGCCWAKPWDKEWFLKESLLSFLALQWHGSLLRVRLPEGRDCLISEQPLWGHPFSAVRLLFPNSPK